MSAHERILRDPAFHELLGRRSRLRWGMTAFIVSAFLAYGMAGLYASEFMGQRIAGSAITWTIGLGYLLIALAIALALLYVRQINRLTSNIQFGKDT